MKRKNNESDSQIDLFSGENASDVGTEFDSVDQPNSDDPALAMLVDRIAALDPDSLTARQALDELYQLSALIKRDVTPEHDEP